MAETEPTKEELLKRITPNEYGETDYGKDLIFLDKIPENDKGCWYGVPENSILIIKGKIIKPKAVKVATKFVIDE